MIAEKFEMEAVPVQLFKIDLQQQNVISRNQLINFKCIRQENQSVFTPGASHLQQLPALGLAFSQTQHGYDNARWMTLSTSRLEHAL